MRQPDPNYLTFAGGKQLDCTNQNTATTAPINPVALRILQTKLPDGSYLIPVPQTILTSGSNAGMGFSSFSFPSYLQRGSFRSQQRLCGVACQHLVVARLLFQNQPVPISGSAGRGDGDPGDPGRRFSPGAPRA